MRPASLITPLELPTWVPGEVSCASDDLGWKEVAHRSNRYAGQDVEIPPMDSFMIVRYRQGATPMYRQLDGRWTRTRCHPGHFSLLSRSSESHWHWTADVEVSHLYLSDDLMSCVACDMFGQDVGEVQLHDVLRGNDPLVNRIVDEVRRETLEEARGGALYVEALGVQLAVHLLRGYASFDRQGVQPCGCLTRAQRALLDEFIDARLHGPITLEDMAAALDLGVWTFGRQVQRSVGCTAHSLVMQRRIERTTTLLRDSGIALKQVAAQCGFSDQAHMTRSFRTHVGTTPGVYRKQ